MVKLRQVQSFFKGRSLKPLKFVEEKVNSSIFKHLIVKTAPVVIYQN